MATKNDVTGSEIKTKVPSEQYKDNWEKIFAPKDSLKEKSRLMKELQETYEGISKYDEDAPKCPPRDTH